MKQIRTHLIAALICLLCIASVHVPKAQGDDVQPTRYRIDAVLKEYSSEDKSKILSSPTVITIDRRPATIEVGQQQQVNIEGDEVVTLQSGIKFCVTPYRLESGDVKLDLNVDLAHFDDRGDEAAVTNRVGVRRIQKVPLGKSFTLPLRRLGKSRYSLTMVISELPRDENETARTVTDAREAVSDTPVNSRRIKKKALRKKLDDWERRWFEELPMPDHEMPFRSHGGIVHFRSGL